MPGANAAAKAANKKKRARAAQERRKKEEAERREMAASNEIYAAKLKEKYADYDTDASGTLDAEQIKALLTDEFSGIEGTPPPNDAEVNLILQISGKDLSTSEGLAMKDLPQAMSLVKLMFKSRAMIETSMAKFDTDNSGDLCLDQLKEFLQDIEDTEYPDFEYVVEDDIVKGIMQEADRSATGKINKDEIVAAAHLYKLHHMEATEVKESKGGCCVIA